MNMIKRIVYVTFMLAFIGGQMPAYADGISPQRAMTGSGTSLDESDSASGGAGGTNVPWWTVGIGAAALGVIVALVADGSGDDVEDPTEPPTTGTGTSTTTTSTSTSTGTSTGTN
jgi:hypothetical protein